MLPIGLIPLFTSGVTNLAVQLQLEALVSERAGEGLPETGIAAVTGMLPSTRRAHLVLRRYRHTVKEPLRRRVR